MKHLIFLLFFLFSFYGYTALINCSECNKEVSNKAKACPNCGAPIAQLLCDCRIIEQSEIGQSSNKAYANIGYSKKYRNCFLIVEKQKYMESGHRLSKTYGNVYSEIFHAVLNNTGSVILELSEGAYRVQIKNGNRSLNKERFKVESGDTFSVTFK